MKFELLSVLLLLLHACKQILVLGSGLFFNTDAGFFFFCCCRVFCNLSKEKKGKGTTFGLSAE